MTVQDLLPLAQLALTVGNLAIMLYALSKFIAKPHNSIETRLTTIEVKMQEMERSLQLGNDEFREQREANKIIQTCMLALIDFEIQYCSNTHYEVTEDLMQAKRVLHEYLSKK